VGLDFSEFNPALALNAILFCDERDIVTSTRPGLPPYLALEAMAQTCGMHLRRRHDFMIQAYLVSMADLRYPPSLGEKTLVIRAALTTETTTAAAYTLHIDDGPAFRMLMGRRTSTGTPDNLFRTRFERLCTTPSFIG
jgi:hypothetical protein